MNRINIYVSDKKTTVKIEIKGRLNGTSIISGTPVYEPIKKSNPAIPGTYSKTRNILHKVSFMSLAEKITKMVEEKGTAFPYESGEFF